MISFFTEEISFKLKDKAKIKKWIKGICISNSKKPGDINFIFCNDEYLLEINKNYLNHDFYTDIITFDQSENEHQINADVYISIDRVTENAQKNSAEFTTELHRVMIHGILHIIGWADKSENDKIKMRLAEDAALKIL